MAAWMSAEQPPTARLAGLNDTLYKTMARDHSLSDSLLRHTLAEFNPTDRASSSLIANHQDAAHSEADLIMQNIEMDDFERAFWVIIFSLMVLIAAGGNTVVIYIVSTNKEMKSVTNYFLVNLSLADTMVSILNVVFNFISMLKSHWPFGKVYCKISNFIAILSISASVFTLTAISCDRYNAILHPLRPRMSHRHALAWILLIWTLSSALALPNAIYSSLVEDRLASDSLAITCTMIWPDGRYPLSSYDHIYNIVILVVTYLVPILTMAILYYKVGKELWGHQAIGENIDKQHRALMAKKKIVKMMIVVVIIFALCWLPYHAFFVINYYVPTIFQDMPLHYQRCYLFMYWLAMSNSMYNPIIIYFMNSNFRDKFRHILCLVCCCRAHQPAPRLSVANINNNNNNNNNSNNNNSSNQQQQPQPNSHAQQPANNHAGSHSNGDHEHHKPRLHYSEHRARRGTLAHQHSGGRLSGAPGAGWSSARQPSRGSAPAGPPPSPLEPPNSAPAGLQRAAAAAAEELEPFIAEAPPAGAPLVHPHQRRRPDSSAIYLDAGAQPAAPAEPPAAATAAEAADSDGADRKQLGGRVWI